MKLFSTLKTYSLAIAGGLLGVLAIVTRVLLSQNSKLRTKVEQKDANLKKAREVLESDIAINEQEDTRLKDVKNEIKNGSSDELTDPNDWVWDDDD